MDTLIGLASGFFSDHPKLQAFLLAFIVVHTATKAFVDALVSSRAEWDKTPLTDDTWFEKALTWTVRILAMTGKVVAYLAGFRPKPKAEINQEKK